MKVNYYPNSFALRKSALILGSFESIHNGHLELIKFAKETGLPTWILIIEDPTTLPNAPKNVYQSTDERLQNLANLGVDYATVLQFDSVIAQKSARDFIDNLLEINKVDKIVIGKDYALGRNREWMAEDLKRYFPETEIIEIKKANNKKISSTLLKELISLGEVDLIKSLSPFPYWRYFTINEQGDIDLSGSIIPHAGIYATYTIYDGIKYWSFVHINQNKQGKLYTPLLSFKNRNIEVAIEFHKISRIIIKSSQDQVQNDVDETEVLKILSQTKK